MFYLLKPIFLLTAYFYTVLTEMATQAQGGESVPFLSACYFPFSQVA